MARSHLRRIASIGAVSWLVACGARSSLPEERAAEGGGGNDVAGPACVESAVEACGSDVGTCKKGTHQCHAGVFDGCVGDVGPKAETCNGLDDDCDGVVDEDFGLGMACDGADTDHCADDVMTCAGCSKGPDNVETCNGTDDNCNGVIDADCEVGDCKPQLEVTGSTPSSPSCIDFPVDAGSTGIIEFPCAGGAVTATLGAISFSGTVDHGNVSLDGVAVVIGPDDCLWKTSHHIGGSLYQGTLEYSYYEHIEPMPGPPKICWQPCTEVGTVTIHWGT